MAGTLTIATLSDGTNSTSSTNCIKGSAKAWAQWRGASTSVINGSYNISSITTTATGYYTIAFTNAMPNANYSAVMSGGIVISGSNSSQTLFADNTGTSITPTTTGFTVATGNGGWAAFANLNYVCIAVFSS